jgi:hypothetical protein
VAPDDAFAFEVEDTRLGMALPVPRWGTGRQAVHGGEPAQMRNAEHEAGVREQL